MEKQGIWEEHWTVAAFMVDTNQKIRLRAIADIFQELANNHANYHNCGFEDMKSSGKFWVLNRQIIIIDEWPRWGQHLRVESWLSMMKGPFSMRHFALFDEKNNVLVHASYLWTSIDREKMKPSAIPDQNFPIVATRPFDLPEPSKIKMKGEVVKSEHRMVRDSDLDIIGHTNNAVYLEWASDLLNNTGIEIHSIHANYTGESFKEDEILIELLESSSKNISIRVSKRNELEVFKMEITPMANV